jgi:ABC-type lipoprotein release transport system permease subunit
MVDTPSWEDQARDFSDRLLEVLRPEQGGLVFDAVRQRSLQAGRGGTDFGVLFLSFSSFLIAAALLLVGLLFRLNLDRRAGEVGLLLALGYRARTVRRLLLAEGVILAVVGGLLGSLAALAYARFLLELLAVLWPGGLERSFLRPHPTPSSLGIGFLAAVAISVLTILWALLGLRRVSPQVLLAGETTTPDLPSSGRRRIRWSPWIAGAAAVGGLGLLGWGWFVRDHEMQAAAFFGSGALLLMSCLAGTWTWMSGAHQGQVGGHGIAALALLGIRNAARHPVRSLLTAGLLASAAFLLVAVESFRRHADAGDLSPTSGSGGYALLAESDVPIFQDLNSEQGRAEISDALERRLRDRFQGTPQQFQEQLQQYRALLARISFVPFRVRAGDDASCLNLYQPRRPRLLGVPHSLIQRGGFRFAGSLAQSADERSNPWSLLNRSFDDGAIPVIGEANTVVWMLGSGLGKDIKVPDERGGQVRLRVVALLQDSVFQSGLLLSEANFLKLYPAQEGYSFFLIQTTTEHAEASILSFPDPQGHDVFLFQTPPVQRADFVKAVLETAMGQRGFEVTPTAERLEGYLAVENTYLTTFQALGGLGLFLGTLGLAVVLLRSIWERRGELALLRALGYRHRSLGWLLLAENSFLLLLGLGGGTLSALLAVAPHLLSSEGAVPWPRLVVLLAVVLLTGLLTIAVALAFTLRAPLLPALRRE